MERRDLLPNDEEDLIGSATTLEKIVHALARRGCADLTSDLGACSTFPCGVGGFCDVYKGVLPSGTRIAIKSLRFCDGPEAVGDTEMRKVLKRAARELYHWSKMQHRNVLPLLGLAIFREQISMVSEWMDNGNLMTYLRLKPDADRHRLCMDVCEGLCYIHMKGMIHGDLKAVNVMVSAQGAAMIADFGNTHLRDFTLKFSNTTRGASLTVRWAAPELLSADITEVSKEADVYAYGMIMLEALTGKVPYEGKSEIQVLKLVVQKGEVPPRPNIDGCDDFWDLLNSCWSQEPSQRPDITIVKNRLQNTIWPPVNMRLVEGTGDSTSSRLTNPLSNRSTLSMGTLGQTGSYYNGLKGNADPASLARGTFSGDAIQTQQQQRPQSSYKSTPPPLLLPMPSQVLPPLNLGFTKAQKPHVTPNRLVGEDSDNGEESSQRLAQTVSAQSPSVSRPLSPPQCSTTERIIVAVTHDAENYVVVDLTGHTDAQAIRERLLSKLHIPDDLHSSFSIYRTKFGEFGIGAALDNTQLLINCQRFGDDKGSLKFLAQRSDAPAEGEPSMPLPPPTIALAAEDRREEEGERWRAKQMADPAAQSVDNSHGEPSAGALSINTMSTPPPYEAKPGSSPTSVAGPSPRTPEPDSTGTALPSVSDPSTVAYTHGRDTDSDCDSTTAVSDTAEGALNAGDYRAHMAAIARMVSGDDPSSLPGSGAATPPAPAALPRVASQPVIRTPPAQPYVPPTTKVISRDFAVQEEEDYDDSDEDGGTLWQVPNQNSSHTSAPSGGTLLVQRTATRPKGLRLRIDGTRPSATDSSPDSTQESGAGAMLITSTLPLEVRNKTATNAGSGSGSGGDVTSRPPLVSHPSSRGSQNWDIRPHAEEVYERLEQFFPNVDLDRPVSDIPSGDTSSDTTGPLPVAGSTLEVPVTGPTVGRHKKSIRVVAAERKKMLERINAARIQQLAIEDSTDLTLDGTIVPAASILRKRSTKMWGGRVEEVTPGTTLGTSASPNVPETIPEGPGRQRPTFKWVKGQLIGRGSFGRVYHAMNLTTGEMIAVKQVELPKTDRDRADSRQITVVDALKSESDTLRDLDHPHIVQYLGFEETMETFSIFLEYVPGGSVGSVLRKFGKFEDGLVRSFSHQIIDGLAYLHKSGILHRDIKADNVLIDPSGICKVCDFGISGRSEHVYNTQEGTLMQGTARWMAPEMWDDDQQGYSAKVDIWSVGCIVLEMQTGKRPWEGVEPRSLRLKVGIQRQPPPLPNDVHLTPLADDFRKKCFAADPAKRPTAAELLTHPWLQVHPSWGFKGFN